jgi:hypothetical protein
MLQHYVFYRHNREDPAKNTNNSKTETSEVPEVVEEKSEKF